jgi:hypothetical protein
VEYAYPDSWGKPGDWHPDEVGDFNLKDNALERGYHIARHYPYKYVRIRRTDEIKAHIIHWPLPDE